MDRWHISYDKKTFDIKNSDITVRMQSSNGSNTSSADTFQARAYWDEDNFNQLNIVGGTRRWTMGYLVYQGQETATFWYERDLDNDNPSTGDESFRECLARR